MLDTRDKIRIFRARLIAAYGAEKGALMFCAIAHDDPKTTCRASEWPAALKKAPGDDRPVAPKRAGSGCPAGFKWVGGYVCAAYNVSRSFCDRNGGRYIVPPVQRAPARCEVESN